LVGKDAIDARIADAVRDLFHRKKNGSGMMVFPVFSPARSSTAQSGELSSASPIVQEGVARSCALACRLRR